MKTLRTTLLAFAVTAALAGCDRGREEARAASDPSATIEKNVESNVQTAMDEARRELAEGNIELSGPNGAAQAAITPKGDLLIDGRAVPVTAEQRALLLDYRRHVSAVASAGMDVGMQGARLAATAVREALHGVFTGKTDEVEQRVEKQAEPIRQAALKLCDHLPAMHRTQQQLAASLPAFAPYATMDLGDIEDCRRDAMDGKAPAAPTPPTSPTPPAPPAKGSASAEAGITAKDVFGKPELPDLPDLPDVG